MPAEQREPFQSDPEANEFSETQRKQVDAWAEELGEWERAAKDVRKLLAAQQRSTN